VLNPSVVGLRHESVELTTETLRGAPCTRGYAVQFTAPR
jgi:hypothetical protein